MPYKTRKVGDKYCVYKKKGGKKVGCTKGTEKAKKKYLAALHIADAGVKMESFKIFFESSHKNIENLKNMIINPDPGRVKEYGGTAYVDMLKKKLDKMLKIVAIKNHLYKSKLSGEYKGVNNQLLSPKNTNEEDAQDRCKRKADQVYGKKTSAYKSGAIVRCRKGKIWKKK